MWRPCRYDETAVLQFLLCINIGQFGLLKNELYKLSIVSINHMNLRTQNVQFCPRFDEKLVEEAEHTQVCEHSESDFSSNLGQKWAFSSTW